MPNSLNRRWTIFKQFKPSAFKVVDLILDKICRKKRDPLERAQFVRRLAAAVFIIFSQHVFYE